MRVRRFSEPAPGPFEDLWLPLGPAGIRAIPLADDDARMLELLEPWRGQRGRVARWIASAGRLLRRRGPSAPLRPLHPSPRLGAQ